VGEDPRHPIERFDGLPDAGTEPPWGREHNLIHVHEIQPSIDELGIPRRLDGCRAPVIFHQFPWIHRPRAMDLAVGDEIGECERPRASDIIEYQQLIDGESVTCHPREGDDLGLQGHDSPRPRGSRSVQHRLAVF